MSVRGAVTRRLYVNCSEPGCFRRFDPQRRLTTSRNPIAAVRLIAARYGWQTPAGDQRELDDFCPEHKKGEQASAP